MEQSKIMDTLETYQYQTPAYGPFVEDAGLLGGGIAHSAMEYQYYPQ